MTVTHLPGCSCGSPECPEWQSIQEPAQPQRAKAEVSACDEEPTTQRYTVKMLHYDSPDHDINGVCRMVRDSLEKGIIPVIAQMEPAN